MSKLKFKNAGPTYGGHANINVASVAIDIHSSVESEFYDARYPEHEWYRHVAESQIISDIPVGATSHTYITRDQHGSAAFIGNGMNDNIPMVGQSVGAVNVKIAYSAIGAIMTNEDARQYTQGFNGNLSQDLGQAMRKGCDNHVESTVMFGNKDLGFEGFINYSTLDVVTAPTGASGQTEWSSKTAEEIVEEINTYLTKVWEESRTLFMPTKIILPLAQYSLLGIMPMVIGGTGVAVTVLEYLKKNNIATSTTGKELEIEPSRYLKGAGTGGTDRMILQDQDEKNQSLPFPMPYTVSAPIPGDLSVKWFSEQKFGEFHVRQKGSMQYVDGI